VTSWARSSTGTRTAAVAKENRTKIVRICFPRKIMSLTKALKAVDASTVFYS
jgi:hypothetical protein